MKLDVTCMRYLTKDDYRVLVAVEMGMRNHELVPVELITSIAKLRHGGSYRILSTLLRHKLVAHANQQYNGYRLSYLGFDILALRTLLAKGVIASVGSQIGVGKESDIFEALDEDGNEVVIKIHRLGRTSFRSVRRTRDYMAGKSKASWLYMSRLAATKEFAFMQALHAHDFPTPVPIAQNRHVVAMSRIHGSPMAQIKSGNMPQAIAERIFAYCVAILKRLAEHGLIHCDFNEFNLMVDEEGKEVTLIDFPQMVSTSHPNASELFARDVNGLKKFFAMKMRYEPPEDLVLQLEDIEVSPELNLDEVVKASGFSKQENDMLMSYIMESEAEKGDADEDGDEQDEGDEDDEEAGGAEEGGEKDAPSSVFNVAGASIGHKKSDKDGGAAYSVTKKDTEGVAEEEEGDEGDSLEDILECDVNSEITNSDDEFDNNDELKHGSKDQGHKNNQHQGGSSFLSSKKRQEVKDRVKQTMHKSNGGSRNSTKKRNKYGKIDKKGLDW